MSEIDWSKAPEWADKFGSGGPYKLPVWLNDEEYEYVDEPGVTYCFADGGCCIRKIEDIVVVEIRNAVWTGEGLPPVGTVCEVEWCEAWHTCEVIAHFQQRCAMVAACTIEYNDGAKALDSYAAECFRPIKTPEQIAAEEREHAVRNACTDIARTLDPFMDCIPSANAAIEVVRAMIDAGYRKP